MFSGTRHEAGYIMISWKWVTAVLCLTLPAGASQVFHMSLDEVFGLAETVLLARVESVTRSSSDCLARVDLALRVGEVLLGPDSLAGTVLDAVYTMDLPRFYTEPDGTEFWESPIVFGSGIEMTVVTGDTVVALAWMPVSGQSVNIVRLEPADSLDGLRERLGSGAGHDPCGVPDPTEEP